MRQNMLRKANHRINPQQKEAAMCICSPLDSFEMGMACGMLFASLVLMLMLKIMRMVMDK